MYGELVPTGGGDPIPLMKPELLIGRRDNCDICLKFPNVSSKHCRLTLREGYWFVEDLESSNGTKVDGNRIAARKRLDPNAKLSVSKHDFNIVYVPSDLGAVGTPPQDDDFMEIMQRSLMDRAGLQRGSSQSLRFNVHDDSAGQTKERRERRKHDG